MAKQVTIDTEECIVCEACVELCPEIFAFDEEEGKSHVIKPEGGDEECIEEAVASVPPAASATNRCPAPVARKAGACF